MGASKEYLFDVGIWSTQSIDLSFVIVRCLGAPPTRVRPACFLNHRSYGSSAEGRHELDATLIKSQRVTEIYDGIVRTGEWQVFWDNSDRLYSVPISENMRGRMIGGSDNIPDTEKLDLHVH